MENSRLRPELQTIVDQFARFRNEYSSLKTHHAAQEELINLQKLELEQMHYRVDQLASTLLEYQKRFSATLNNLESENRRLHKNIDDLNREYENTRANDNEYIVEAQRNNDEYCRKLEENLNELRSEMASIVESHEEQIRCIEKRHSDEISEYKKQFEQMNALEKRHSEEIASYRSKLEEMHSLQAKDSEEISARRKTNDQASRMVQESTASSRTSAEFAHPALSEDIGNKRKRTVLSSSRWARLDVSTEKEVAVTQMAFQRKKKRLYHADNEAVVDLES